MGMSTLVIGVKADEQVHVSRGTESVCQAGGRSGMERRGHVLGVELCKSALNEKGRVLTNKDTPGIMAATLH